MKRIIVTLTFVAVGLPFVWLASTMAQQGPNIVAFPDATATQCASGTPVAADQTLMIAASTPAPGQQAAPRLCFTVINTGGTNPARCGDNVSAVQGVVLNPVPASQPTGSVGGSWSACVTTGINCCGVGGSTTIGGGTYIR